MINSIELNNFQCHTNLKLDFTSGINVITGKSDSGKSAVLRALRYAVFNKPAQNNYPSHWIKNKKGNLTDECSVIINKNNIECKRFKNKSDNGYVLDGEIYKAIRQDVPDVVNDYFNLSSINLQNQLDSHFLLSETPGQIAKFLNELIKLDDIDLYLSAVEKMKRVCKRELESKEKQLTEINNEIISLNWIERAAKLYAEIETAHKEWRELDSMHSITFNQKEQYIQIEKELAAIPDIQKAEKLIKSIESKKNELEIENNLYNIISSDVSALILFSSYLVLDIDACVGLYQELSTIGGKQQEMQIYTDKLQDSISECNSLDDAIPDSVLSDIEEKLEKVSFIKNKVVTYKNKYSFLSDTIHQYEELLESEVDNKLSIEKLTETMPDICPLCGNNIGG